MPGRWFLLATRSSESEFAINSIRIASSREFESQAKDHGKAEDACCAIHYSSTEEGSVRLTPQICGLCRFGVSFDVFHLVTFYENILVVGWEADNKS